MNNFLQAALGLPALILITLIFFVACTTAVSSILLFIFAAIESGGMQ